MAIQSRSGTEGQRPEHLWTPRGGAQAPFSGRRQCAECVLETVVSGHNGGGTHSEADLRMPRRTSEAVLPGSASDNRVTTSTNLWRVLPGLYHTNGTNLLQLGLNW